MPGFLQIGFGDTGVWVWAIPFALGLLAAGATYVLTTRGHPLLWRAGAVGLAAVAAWAIVHVAAEAERAALRSTLEARSADLTARALAPGSPLACLDGLANPALETACQKALFSHPETLAAAVAYVDARLSLVSDGLAIAERDGAFAERLERTRRALEADRFGLVAHVLTTRGCTETDCAAFAALRETRQVTSNLRDRTFDAQVALYAAAWAEGPALASVSHAPSQGPAVAEPAEDGSAPSGVPVSSKYDFPSAASIPPVSIMDPEPSRPAAAAPRQQPVPRAAARSSPQQKPADSPAPPTVITPPSSTGAR